MNCYIHEQKEAAGACVHCGKFICEDCRMEIKGKNYCKHCVSEIFEETNKKVEKLEDKASQSPMVFMNAGGGSSSSSSASTVAGGHGDFVCYKSKVTAAILAFFLGGFGIHKFYLGNVGLGIVYLIFCWTFIPAFIAFIEGIILICTSDAEFSRKYGSRVTY